MAVQQNRKTPSKRGMRRAHDAIHKPALSEDPTTGTRHLRHHISPDGFYRGREIIPAEVVSEEESEAEGGNA